MHFSYKQIINKQEFPVYNQIINMAASTSYGGYVFNMGTVLDLLKKHIFWEQYLTLGLPLTKDMEYPLTFFPKDVLEVIKRAICLRKDYEEECVGWRTPYELPYAFNANVSFMCNESDIFFKALRYVGTFQDDKDFMQRLTFIYGEIGYFSDLIRKYNYEYKNLIEYLCYLQDYEGYYFASDIMRDLTDYNNMASQMAKMFDKKNKYEKYPKFLMSRHNIISKNYKIMKEEHKNELFVDAYNGSLEFTSGKYAIIEPKSTDDIFKEATQMHNCVASYIDRIIERRTQIVFLREKDNIEDSLVTVEVKNKHICQAYQKNNTQISLEQKQFLEKYAKSKKIFSIFEKLWYNEKKHQEVSYEAL